MLIYKISCIPDLTLNKYQAYENTGIEGLVEEQTKFIRQLHQVSLLGQVNIHFLFEYDPDKRDGEKLSIFIAFTNVDGLTEYDEKIRNIIKASIISEYYSFIECTDIDFVKDDYLSSTVLYKKEQILPIIVDKERKELYVVPNWKLREQNRIQNALMLMKSFNEKVCYKVDLFTQENLEEEIHKSFESTLMFLKNSFSQEKGLSEYSKMINSKKDPNIDQAIKTYEDWLNAIDIDPSFICRVSVYSNDVQYSKLLLDSIVCENIESGTYSTKVFTTNVSLYHDMDEFPTGYHIPNVPLKMAKWTTTYTAKEIATFVRLPALYDGETVELPKETSACLSNKGMVIGRDTNKHNVKIEEKLFAKHMFVCGVPGAGKTNTMLHIANSLWNYERPNKDGIVEKAHIPFLVLEPAKREYRELSLFDIPELIIFSPSANTKFPFKLNPFEFPIGLTVSEHIGHLCEVFECAFPIAPPAPFILDRAIQAVYENKGWSMDDVNLGDKEYPKISELYNQFKEELENTKYDGEVRGNIQSVLEMRIGSLLRREKKKIFDVAKSSLTPEEWITKPVIIELEALGEGPANFVTLLLCTLIRETLKVNPLADKEKVLRHVIFIEEAHNLIAAKSETDDPMNSNPKIGATAYIVKMLAEVRALREGIIIADQLPTAMAPEVIKNTNIKLIHRLTAADDRELVGSTMSASPLQIESIATYTSGQALMSYEKLLRPFEVQISLVEEHGEKTPNDQELYDLMMKKPGYYNLVRQQNINEFEFLRQVYVKNSENLRCLEANVPTEVSDSIDLEKAESYLESSVEDLHLYQMSAEGIREKLFQINTDIISEDIIGKFDQLIKQMTDMYELKLTDFAIKIADKIQED